MPKSPLPPARQILSSPVHFLAFGFGTGLAPVAPGTFGTLVGIPFFLVLQPFGLPIYLAVTAVLFALGCYLCGESARRLGVHDHGGIVWDEIVAFLVTMLPWLLGVPRATSVPLWAWLAIGFGLFRFFDILKPPPANLADRHMHGGFGIMLDDLIAAVYAAGLLAMAMLLSSHGWL
ncbi:MAG: phosphatidylglycerophosphatase A family protein [Nevskiales bacterium]